MGLDALDFCVNHKDVSITIYTEESNTVTSLTHSGALHFFPISALDLSMNYDHVRRQISADTYKHILFLQLWFVWPHFPHQCHLQTQIGQHGKCSFSPPLFS